MAASSGAPDPVVYWNGEYLPLGEVAVSPEDRGWLFADSLYEVVRSYDGRLFRPRAHLRRLEHGARALRFQRTDFPELGEVARRLLELNGLDGEGDGSVYFQVTRGAAPRSHAFPDPSTPLTVYGRARAFQARSAEHEEGIAAILTPDLRWARCDIKTTGLTANVLASQQAAERGAAEALFVRDGVVVEGTHTNLVAVVGRTLITHPRTNVILPGVTLEAVLEISRREGMELVQRPLRAEELAGAAAGCCEELFVAGTTTEIMPVVQLDGAPVGGGEPGPVTRRIQRLFFEAVRDPASWIWEE